MCSRVGSPAKRARYRENTAGAARHSAEVAGVTPPARVKWYISSQTPPARASAGITPRQVARCGLPSLPRLWCGPRPMAIDDMKAGAM